MCEPGNILHRVTLQRHLEQLSRDGMDEIPGHRTPLAVPSQRQVAGLEGEPMERGAALVRTFEGLLHHLRVEIREHGGGGADGEVGWAVDPVEVPVVC